MPNRTSARYSMRPPDGPPLAGVVPGESGGVALRRDFRSGADYAWSAGPYFCVCVSSLAISGCLDIHHAYYALPGPFRSPWPYPSLGYDTTLK